MRERLPCASKVYAVLFMLLAAHGQQVSAQIAQATAPGASSIAVASSTPPSSSPATEKAIATMLAAAFNNAASQVAGAAKVIELSQAQSAGSTPASAMPTIDAAKYPELATLLANNTKGSDPLGLRTAVATALSQQQGAGDIYAAQLEQAAGIINGFTSTPLQFGTLGSVRNYITRVVQVNTLLGAIQRQVREGRVRPMRPTALFVNIGLLEAQRLLFGGTRLAINFITTFPVAFLVYLSRIFIAARDLVQVPRDSINVAIASLNLVILISTNPINFAGLNAGEGPGGIFAPGAVRIGAGGGIGPGGGIFGPSSGIGTGIGAAGKRLLGVNEQFQELMSQLEAAGISTRELLDTSSAPTITTTGAAVAEGPTSPLARVFQLSEQLDGMLSAVQDVAGTIIPQLETVLSIDDVYNFRQNLFGGDPLAAVSESLRNISSQVSDTAKALVAEVLASSGVNTVLNSALGNANVDSPDGVCILPPITNVSAINIGNGTNGLPPGVIGLPAVKELGLPAVPFPGGFPATPPAFNAAVLNLLRTINSALALTFAILNLIQTILEWVGDVLAVPPAEIALVTGPILFGIASVEYYNALVAAFPAVPNGYLNDLNTALGGLGSGLTGNVFLGSSGGPLRTALGSLRTSLGTLGTAQGTLRGLTGGLARA
ncbi:hypothetical protein HaLaN_04703 [Haematococcus lacustris]|uniref:Uncharacterized protein n=1 Tax=Haematococcus lacustris TaxID=44745 RepID=A0A699YH90_HAELA|nr:hypothetical protein HaLaN_04703 [Haematococcus lacustris]